MKALFYHKNLKSGGAERILLELFTEFSSTGVDAKILLGRRIGPMMDQADPDWLYCVPEYRVTFAERILRRMGLLDANFPERQFKRILETLQPLVPLSSQSIWRSIVEKTVPAPSVYRIATAIQTATPNVLFSSIVESGHLPVLMALRAWKAQSKNSLRPYWIAVEHNNTLQRLVDYYREPAEFELWKSITRLVYSECDHVVAVSQGVKDGLVSEFGIPASKITVIHNPVPVSRIRMVAPADTEQRFILSAGRLHSQKRQDHLIRAFATIANKVDVQLWLAGDGGQLDALQQLARELGVFDRIRFLGARSDLWNLMKSAECFVLTSRYEGFGMVLTEAMAAGCPVVSYDVDYGPREFINDGINGRLVRDGDVAALSAALLQQLSPEENHESMVANAVKDVMQFDIPLVASEYVKLIDRNASQITRDAIHDSAGERLTVQQRELVNRSPLTHNAVTRKI